MNVIDIFGKRFSSIQAALFVGFLIWTIPEAKAAETHGCGFPCVAGSCTRCHVPCGIVIPPGGPGAGEETNTCETDGGACQNGKCALTELACGHAAQVPPPPPPPPTTCSTDGFDCKDNVCEQTQLACGHPAQTCSTDGQPCQNGRCRETGLSCGHAPPPPTTCSTDGALCDEGYCAANPGLACGHAPPPQEGRPALIIRLKKRR